MQYKVKWDFGQLDINALKFLRKDYNKILMSKNLNSIDYKAMCYYHDVPDIVNVNNPSNVKHFVENKYGFKTISIVRI